MKNNCAIQFKNARRDSYASQSRRLSQESMEKISRSIAYMSQHLDQSLQVAILAAQVNVSPSHYFALFKRQTGRAPIDYFIRLRMQHAYHLFDSTSSSVMEVAAALGYNDPFYFSRVFKSVNHVAPSKYRLISGKKSNHSHIEDQKNHRPQNPLKPLNQTNKSHKFFNRNIGFSIPA